MSSLPNKLRMLKGSLLYRSTPAEVTNTKRLILLGDALIKLPVAMESVCSGPFPPFHLETSSNYSAYLPSACWVYAI